MARSKATSDAIIAERNTTVSMLRAELQEAGTKSRQNESELATAKAQLDIVSKVNREAADTRHTMMQLQGQVESLTRQVDIQATHRQALEESNSRLMGEREGLQRRVLLLSEEGMKREEELKELRGKLEAMLVQRQRAIEEAKAHEEAVKAAREEGNKEKEALRLMMKQVSEEKKAKDKLCADLEIKLNNTIATHQQNDAEQSALIEVLRAEVSCPL